MLTKFSFLGLFMTYFSRIYDGDDILRLFRYYFMVLSNEQPGTVLLQQIGKYKCFLLQDNLIFLFILHLNKRAIAMIGTKSQLIKIEKISNTDHKPHPQEQIKTIRLKNVANLKHDFIDWIKSMPMQQRFLAAKVFAPGIAFEIRNTLTRIQDENNELNKNLQIAEYKKISKRIQKNIFQSLIFVSDGNNFYDNLCFDFATLEYPEKLYDMLMVSLQVPNSSPIMEMQKMRRQTAEMKQILEKSASQEQVIYHTLTFLRHQILVNYTESLKNSKFISLSLEEQKRRKKQFSIHWKMLSEQNKRRILLLGKQNIQQLLKHLKEQEIFVKLTELERQIVQLQKLDKNQFCNKIFKCKMKKSFYPVIAYYQLVYKQWKWEIQKNRKKKYHKNHKDNFKNQKYEKKKNIQKPRNKSMSQQSNETNQTEYQKILEKFSQEKEKMTHNKSRKKHLQNQKNNLFQKSNVRQFSKKQIKLKQKEKQKEEKCNKTKKPSVIHFQKSPEKEIQSTKKHESPNNSQVQKQRSTDNVLKQLKWQSESEKSTIVSTKSSTKVQTPKKQSLLSPQQINSLSLLKLSEEQMDISDLISEQANEFHERRVIAFERLQFLLHYYHIPIKLFGSCASGIAIKNSDIDIAIDSCIISMFHYLPESERIKAALEWLEDLFKHQGWIVTIKLIKTAAIPVIKLKLNTAIPFLDESYGQYYQFYNRQHNKGQIEADITIETKNKSSECDHLGLISTNAINSWLEKIKNLHTIVVLLKHFLTVRKLNVTYQGGLNTFSTIVLIMAYIYDEGLQDEDNPSVILQGLSKFYGFQFDQTSYAIDIGNYGRQSIFFKKPQKKSDGKNSYLSKADIQIRDPMSNKKNMTRNCYQFSQIKKLFRDIYQQCFLKTKKEICVQIELIKQEHQFEEIVEKINDENEKTQKELLVKILSMIKANCTEKKNKFSSLFDI